MNAAELDAIVQSVQSIATVVSQLGLPGLMALILAGPALVVMAMLYFEHLRNVRQEKEREAYHAMIERALESYRTDSMNMLGEVSRKHAEIVSFYNDNVSLVKETKRMADSMQTLVVNNTRALERLITIIETQGRHI